MAPLVLQTARTRVPCSCCVRGISGISEVERCSRNPDHSEDQHRDKKELYDNQVWDPKQLRAYKWWGLPTSSKPCKYGAQGVVNQLPIGSPDARTPIRRP